MNEPARNMGLRVIPGAGAEPERRRQIVAVGGGKGGIGKSLVAANLGVHAAQRGQRVVLIDADLGGANLHTVLGMRQPSRTLSDFVERRVDALEDVIVPTHLEGLRLISGALDFLGAANPKYTQKLRLLREISRIDVDCVIIDLGGGTGFNILDFFLIADHGILTIVPEPTSIENAYRFIKAAYYRRLKTVAMAWDLRAIVDDVMDSGVGAELKTPAELVAGVEARDKEAGRYLREELARFPIKLVVNQVRTPQEQHLGSAICDACHRYFGIEIELLGTVPFDDAVWRSVRVRKPVLMDAPEAAASKALGAIADELGL